MRAGVTGMKKRGWGRIINTASAHSLVASPFKAAYVSAKHGIAGLTKTVALELATFKITCNCISPGYVWTPLVEKQIPDTMKARNMTTAQFIHDVLLPAPPTRGHLSGATSGFVPGGRASSSKAKRLTPGGLCSSSVGTGSAQSGVGPSTNRLTSLVSGTATSTSTLDCPSRLTSRMVNGLGSPTLAGLGTVSRAANSALSSVLATLVMASSAPASTGMQSFSQTA